MPITYLFGRKNDGPGNTIYAKDVNELQAAVEEISTRSGGGGSGDVVGPSSAVDSEIAVFDSTTGKLIKRATGSGIAKLASGVLSVVTAPSGAIVGDTDTQTLTNKTLTTPTIASLTNAQHNHTNAAGGGQFTDAALSAAVGITKGGTGATDAATARTNLELPVSGNPVVPFMTSQVVYGTGMFSDTGNTTQALTANTIYAVWFPWVVESGVSFDQGSIYVQTAAAAGKIARVMAFAPDGTGGKPSTLLKDYGTVLVDSTGIKTISSTLTPTNNGAGFWLAVVSDGTPTLFACGNTNIQPMGTNGVSGTQYRGWSYDLGGTTAPSPFSASATLNSAAFAPLFYLRRT